MVINVIQCETPTAGHHCAELRQLIQFNAAFTELDSPIVYRIHLRAAVVRRSTLTNRNDPVNCPFLSIV